MYYFVRLAAYICKPLRFANFLLPFGKLPKKLLSKTFEEKKRSLKFGKVTHIKKRFEKKDPVAKIEKNREEGNPPQLNCERPILVSWTSFRSAPSFGVT